MVKKKEKEERCKHEMIIEVSVDHYKCVDCEKETSSPAEFNGDLND